MSLVQWTMDFVRNRDLLRRKLQSLDANGNIVHANFEEKKEDYFVKESLLKIEDIVIAAKKSDKEKAYHVAVVCYNTEENFKVFLGSWNELAKHERLTFYFVNPNSLTQRKWIIKPFLHARICEPDKIENGLKTLFGTVEEWRG